MTFKKQYWKYSLIVLILGLGVAIFVRILPFLGGLLGAATLYLLLRNQMRHLTQKRMWRPSWAAALLLIEASLCFLIPLSGVVWMLVIRIQEIAVDPHELLNQIEHLAHLVEAKTGYDFLSHVNLTLLLSGLSQAGQFLMEGIYSFGINLLVLLFVLYFMLIGDERMETYFYDLLPFDPADKGRILHEMHLIVRSNAIGIPLLAVIQGAVAWVGYMIFKTPDPLFFGLLTCFATIIPIVGTALVWLPLSLYMAATGAWSGAIGVVAYALLVIIHVDNLVRFLLQKRMANTHPLITIFGVIIGLSLFGFMGVIFGPLLLELFILLVDIFKRQYLDSPQPADTLPDNP